MITWHTGGEVAGILLTGGASRRMGTPKALVTVHGRTMAESTAAVLSEVCSSAIEVGPGYTNLPAIREEPSGDGPLTALLAGWRHLSKPPLTLVLAVDMPYVTTDALRAIRDSKSALTVVPLVDHRLQPLCARWTDFALTIAETLHGNGVRSLKGVLREIDYDALQLPSPLAARLRDIDTPEDLIDEL